MKLFYRTIGDGPPVIILHGLFGMSDNWLTIGRRIADHYQVFLLDQRNHGQSPHSDVFNSRVLKDDLAEFIIDHSLNNVKLIGHSMGGKVAMLYAHEHPEKVDKLVAVDIAPKTYQRPHFKKFLEVMMQLPLETFTTRKEIDQHLARNIPQPAIRNFLLKNLARDSQNRFYWKLNLPAIYNNLSEILSFVEVESSFEKDTLFIKGGLSDYIESSDFPLIKRLFPKAQIVTIPHATHWVHADAPEEFCAHLRRFFSKRG